MCVVKRLRSNWTRCARLTTVSRTSARSLSTSSHPPGEHSRGGSRGRTQRADRRTSGRTDRVARQRRGHALRTSTRSPGAMSASTLRCRSMCSSTSRPRDRRGGLLHGALRQWCARAAGLRSRAWSALVGARVRVRISTCPQERTPRLARTCRRGSLGAQRRGPGGIHRDGCRGLPGLSKLDCLRKLPMSNHERPDGDGSLTRLISPARLSPYLDLASGSESSALDLYVANLDQSAGLHRLISVAEVLLRNALDAELTRWTSPDDWMIAGRPRLSSRALQELQRVMERLSREGHDASHDRIVAGVGLGFWTYLMARAHESTLWVPALRHAFPHLRPRSRQAAFDQALRMLHLRNRIAHHEKVITRDPEGEAAGILELLSWIDPAAADWTAEVCRSDIPGLRLPESRWPT